MPPLLVPACGGYLLHVNCFFMSCRATIKDPQNQEVLSNLIMKVKSHNQSFDIDDIRDKQKSKLFKLACVIIISFCSHCLSLLS